MYLKEETINTITIEKSKFICYMKHIKTETEFKDYLSSIKKKHYDASHVCSGFISNNIKRSNDDGEPSGTAGAPILNVLEKNSLNEMCAIVVRYFGGIKLGAGGLIRAYSNAVSQCLTAGILVENVSYPKYEITLPYDIANKLEHFIKNHTILLETKYDENITFVFALDDKDKINTIIEYTKGIKPNYTGEENIEKIVE